MLKPMHSLCAIFLFLVHQTSGDFVHNVTDDCSCVRKFKPVCGNDRVTYDNECELRCASETNSGLRVVYSGTCCPKNVCPSYSDPVCDNFGRTHDNECRFHHQKCIFHKIQNKRLRIVHKGECKPTERVLEDCSLIICDEESDGKVCDEFEKTHNSSCGFDRLNCELRNADKLEIQLAYHGQCKNESDIMDDSEEALLNQVLANKTLAEEIVKEQLHEMSIDLQGAGDLDNAKEETSTEEVQMIKNDIIRKDVVIPTSTTESSEQITVEETTHSESTLEKSSSSPVNSGGNEPKTLIRAQSSMTNTAAFIKPNELLSTDLVNLKATEDHKIDVPVTNTTAIFTSEGLTSTFHAAYTTLAMIDSTTELQKANDIKVSANLPDNIADLLNLSDDEDVDDTTNSTQPRSSFATSIRSTFDSVVNSLSNSVSANKKDMSNNLTIDFDVSIPCSAAHCDKTSEPICDTQSTTHRNLCLFKFHACKTHRHDGTIVEVAHAGKCNGMEKPVPRECGSCGPQSEKVMVCDNKNQTHPTICHFAKWNCQMAKWGREERVLVHVGKCQRNQKTVQTLEDDLCPVKCADEERTVCDETLTEHRNLCAFRMHSCNERKAGRIPPRIAFLKPCPQKDLPSLAVESTLIKSQGPLDPMFECPTPTCDNETSPICDSQGNEHLNECYFTFARCIAAQNGVVLSIRNEGKCTECQTDCTGHAFTPMCGSDFVSYANECSFKKAQCLNPKLEFMFNGSCDVCFTDPCPELGEDANERELVCDQNGQTRSRCEFDMLRCVLERNFGFNLTVIHEGKCCAPIEDCFNKTKEDVCASDFMTYPSMCHFEVAKCQNLKIKGKDLDFISNGTCESQNAKIDAMIENLTSTEVNKELPEINIMETDCSFKTECGNDYAPVCGSDNVTYTNVCVLRETKCLKQISVSVAYVGECCHMDCPGNWNPVCDSEGRNHQNLCTFGVHRCIEERVYKKNISISKFELCHTSAPCVECSKNYKPICGNNEETFVNECEMNRWNCLIDKNITRGSKVIKAYEGECCHSRQCAYEYSPVCDSNGTTHANECVFEQEKCKAVKISNITLSVQYKGQCCNQPCEDTFNPVCDGQNTYLNICRFRIAQCEAERRGQIVALAYAGECCALPQGNCSESGSVCDSDGQTHNDKCRFMQKKCVMERNHLKTISVVHNGECCSIEACHKGAEPVCDSRGGTHASMCHFQNTKCIHDKIHPNNTLIFAYKGTCCLAICENNWDPVCDQHGSVYRNKCFFKLKSCELGRRSGGPLLETPCPERRARRNWISTHRHPFLKRSGIPTIRVH